MEGLTFMTNHADQRTRAQRAGVVAFLEKPVEDAVLLAAIGRALAAAEARSAAEHPG
jgi:FixJ family two-component response regulator